MRKLRDADPDNVVQLDKTRVPAFEFKHIRSGLCDHWHVIVDDRQREVRCRKCNAIVDPFDALVKLSLDWDRYVSNKKRALQESEKASARLEELKRQERNARTRIKRLQQKLGDLMAEVGRYETDK